MFNSTEKGLAKDERRIVVINRSHEKTNHPSPIYISTDKRLLISEYIDNRNYLHAIHMYSSYFV